MSMIGKYKGFFVKCYIFLRIFIFDFSKMEKFIPKKSRKIVDVGCGYGLFSFTVAKDKKRKIIGCDFDKKRIDYLNSINKEKNISFLCVDATSTSVDADVIVCIDLLHHISFKDQEIFLKKIKNNSSKNVTVLIKDMDKGGNKLNHFFNVMIDYVGKDKPPFYYRSKNEFIKLFERQGFEVKSAQKINKWYIPLNHVLFVLGKKK